MNEKKSISKEEEVRIGVYVCHCGLNIAGSVDCEAVAKYALNLPGVVISKDYRYVCSDPGQELIKQDIKEHRLNRVVVASCSPRLHEPTFRAAVKDAGLNPYLFEMANLREHCSWVHLYEREKATEKAKDLVKASVYRARYLKSQEEFKVPIKQKALVIGGGVAGIQAALDLADTGYQVYLVEKEPTIGGRMAQIDKTFPTMDCSICILAPKMAEAGRHPNITLLTYSEVQEITGYIGNFTVKVLRKPRYVTSDCTACGDCAEVCPVVLPNEFDVGLASRKAIYISFPQAVPSIYVVDMEHCLSRETIGCEECIKACERQAIDMDMQPEVVTLEVGTIVMATGLGVYDPMKKHMYGYGSYENVITSLEFERLINAAGPTEGHLVRPSDGKIPKNVAFIQCIGSRSERAGNLYCSNVCCMNTVKDALLIKEHWPEVDIFVFYQDIRAFGKGFEQLFRRSKEEGVTYIRGMPSKVQELPDGNLLIMAEDTLLGEKIEMETELVILSLGLEGWKDGGDPVTKMLALAKTEEGFLLEAHPKLQPVDTAIGGVFLAGCAEGPKDIKDSVTQASAAAARAGILMAKGEVSVEALTPIIIEDLCKSCGLCANVCTYNALVWQKGQKTPPELIPASCAGCGSCGAECPSDAIHMRHFPDESIFAQIEAITEEEPEKKVLIFACNWCSYAGADLAGVSRMQYPPVSRVIRTMCSARVAEKFVLYALARGIGMVLVSGCHLGDCHYNWANKNTERRVKRLWIKLERMGLDKERLQLGWFSAAEGAQFAQKIKEMAEYLEKIPPEEIKKGKEVLRKLVPQARKEEVAA